ncbi:MAG: DUF4376 domain-containing protein [Moraxellaceae bacterium]|nr:DUF4376 domain-containing protein [Moraxellaceae bacterium]
MNKTIHHYHPDTKELLGQGLADESPLEPGKLLLPSFSTRKVPPAAGVQQIAVFDEAGDRWTLAPDFRNAQLYRTSDGTAVTVATIGPQPADTTGQPRPTSLHDWQGGNWTLNMTRAHEAQWQAIQAERDRRKIAGGIHVGVLWFHSDEGSRIQYLGLKDRARDMVAAGGAMADTIQILDQSVRWKTMDGTFVPMTAQLAFDVVSAVGVFDALLFAVAEEHHAAMKAAADPLAYDFTGNWPDAFTD